MQKSSSSLLPRLSAAVRHGLGRCLDQLQRITVGPAPPAGLASPVRPSRRWRWRLKNEMAALPGFNEEVQSRLAAALPSVPDAATVSTLSLVFDELLTNVIKYAHPGEPPGGRLIDVCLQLENGVAGIEIEDDGIPFDPTIPVRAADAADVPLEERTIGGWGLALVRKLADNMQYRRAGERNRVTWQKRYPSTQSTST